MIAYSTPTAMLAVSITLTGLCIFMVALRFFPHRKQPLLEDWLCLISLLMTIGMAIGIIVGIVQHALGYPPSSRKAYDIEARQIEWGVQLIQVLQLGSTKLSFLMFFRRVFVTHNRSIFSIASWIMITLLMGWTIAFFFVFLFACKTHFDQWWLKPTTCVNTLSLETGFALSDCLMDYIVITMPLPMIWRLHMNVNRKIAVSGVFALGALAVIISTVRVVIVYQIKRADERADRHSGDVDKDLVLTLALFWFLIESQTALIAACLLPIYGLFGRQLVDSVTRSAQSLRSLISYQDSKPREWRRPYTNSPVRNNVVREPRKSDASRTPILPASFAGTEPVPPMAAFEMSNWDEETTRERALKNGEVHVQTAVTRTEAEA